MLTTEPSRLHFLCNPCSKRRNARKCGIQCGVREQLLLAPWCDHDKRPHIYVRRVKRLLHLPVRGVHMQ